MVYPFTSLFSTRSLVQDTVPHVSYWVDEDLRKGLKRWVEKEGVPCDRRNDETPVQFV